MIPKLDIGRMASKTASQDLTTTPGSRNIELLNGDYASSYNSYTALPFDGVMAQSVSINWKRYSRTRINVASTISTIRQSFRVGLQLLLRKTPL